MMFKFGFSLFLFFGPYILIWNLWDDASFFVQKYLPVIGLEANNSFIELLLAEIIPNFIIGLPVLFIISFHIGLINYVLGFKYGENEGLSIFGGIIVLIYLFFFILAPFFLWLLS